MGFCGHFWAKPCGYDLLKPGSTWHRSKLEAYHPTAQWTPSPLRSFGVEESLQCRYTLNTGLPEV